MGYLEYVEQYYDVHFELPWLPIYYEFVIIEIKLQKIRHQNTTMQDAVYLAKLLRPRIETYREQERPKMLSPFTTEQIRAWVSRLTTSSSCPVLPPGEGQRMKGDYVKTSWSCTTNW